MRHRNNLKTHRCQQLLEYNKTSSDNICIRYGSRFESIPDKDIAWWLSNLEWDMDYDTKYLTTVCAVKFCPFCGCEFKE